MLGAAQERWLLDALDKSTSRWNVLAQQVLMAQVDFAAGPDRRVTRWTSGTAYQADTADACTSSSRERKPSNPIVLTGDIHSNWVNDLKADYRDPSRATIGTEFVGTSISSGGDGQAMTRRASPGVPA